MAFEKKEIKNIRITVRFSEEEKQLIDKYIAENNYKNITDFIREVISKEIINK